jgi:hypothetical protein
MNHEELQNRWMSSERPCKLPLVAGKTKTILS